MGDRTLAPGTGAAHAPVNVVAGRLKLVDATIDRTPCDPCRQSGCGDAAKPKGQGFIGRKQASPTLVEKRDDQLPARPDVIKVDHGFRLIPGHRVAPTKFAILSLRSQGPLDSIISPRALTWSERQAALLRRVGAGERVNDQVDWENVIEEIESVGRSELAAVTSLIRQVLLHLIKLAVEVDATAVRHWRGEIVAFHSEIRRRYAPSMRQRIDLEDLWQSAREQLWLSYEREHQQAVLRLPERCPYRLESVLAERIDSDALVADLRRAAVPTTDPEFPGG